MGFSEIPGSVSAGERGSPAAVCALAGRPRVERCPGGVPRSELCGPEAEKTVRCRTARRRRLTVPGRSRIRSGGPGAPLRDSSPPLRGSRGGPAIAANLSTTLRQAWLQGRNPEPPCAFEVSMINVSCNSH